jgi:hypothetical protein
MQLLSILIVMISFAIAFQDARSGRSLVASIRDGVLDAAALQACVSAIAVLLAGTGSWQLVGIDTVATSVFAAATASAGVLLARLAPGRVVAHW